jgi:hypothetical protein
MGPKDGTREGATHPGHAQVLMGFIWEMGIAICEGERRPANLIREGSDIQCFQSKIVTPKQKISAVRSALAGPHETFCDRERICAGGRYIF